MRRRTLLLSTALSAVARKPAARPSDTRLWAAWDDAGGRHFAGVLETAGPSALHVLDAVELPTRAHGLVPLPGGELLLLSRRPGPWIARWAPGRSLSPVWLSEDRRLCGHAVLLDGRRVACTEMDLESERGLVTVRDLARFDVLAEWPTGGVDPHALLAANGGGLLVANGGVASRPETGRRAVTDARIDSSLVLLDTATGAERRRWTLPDRWLSLRHLARHRSGRVGIALQAGHADADARDASPLLAVLDGSALATIDATRGHGGYAGDIVATPEGWLVSATRAGRLLHWQPDPGHCTALALPEVCALAVDSQARPWAGGSSVLRSDRGRTASLPGAVRLDNHWLVASD